MKGITMSNRVLKLIAGQFQPGQIRAEHRKLVEAIDGAGVQRLDALKAAPKVNVARLDAVVDSLIAVGVITPHQIGLPWYGEASSGDRQAAIERWLKS